MSRERQQVRDKQVTSRHIVFKREHLLNLRCRTVNLRRPERARNVGPTGPERSSFGSMEPLPPHPARNIATWHQCPGVFSVPQPSILSTSTFRLIISTSTIRTLSTSTFHPEPWSEHPDRNMTNWHRCPVAFAAQRCIADSWWPCWTRSAKNVNCHSNLFLSGQANFRMSSQCSATSRST